MVAGIQVNLEEWALDLLGLRQQKVRDKLQKYLQLPAFSEKIPADLSPAEQLSRIVDMVAKQQAQWLQELLQAMSQADIQKACSQPASSAETAIQLFQTNTPHAMPLWADNAPQHLSRLLGLLGLGPTTCNSLLAAASAAAYAALEPESQSALEHQQQLLEVCESVVVMCSCAYVCMRTFAAYMHCVVMSSLKICSKS